MVIKNCCHTAKIKLRCHFVTASHQLRVMVAPQAGASVNNLVEFSKVVAAYIHT